MFCVSQCPRMAGGSPRGQTMAMCMYGMQRHTSKFCHTRRTGGPSTQSISRQILLGLSPVRITRQPPSWTWQLANKSKHSTTSIGLEQRNTQRRAINFATGTKDFVRVWDNDGRLLVTIKVGVTPYYNTGLLWSNNHLFAISDGHIKQFEASIESAVAEWPVPDVGTASCIALPKHKEFIVYSTKRTVTCWDTTTRTQCGLVEHTQDIRSIAISPDDQFLAIGGQKGNIIIRKLAHITVSFVYC